MVVNKPRVTALVLLSSLESQKFRHVTADDGLDRRLGYRYTRPGCQFWLVPTRSFGTLNYPPEVPRARADGACTLLKSLDSSGSQRGIPIYGCALELGAGLPDPRL